MIIVNYWQDKGYNSETDGFMLDLQAIVNDVLDLTTEPPIIEEVIFNQEDHDFKDETLYEIQLIRSTIMCDPVDERSFIIDRVIELTQCKESGQWNRAIVRT